MIAVMDAPNKFQMQAVVAVVVFGAAQAAFANCWQEASSTYKIPVAILAAVAKAESGFNVTAVHANANKSKDFGLMQINDSHLPVLSRYGIKEKDLYDGCTNLKVGAWILASNASRLGWTWDAIGAYNVGCKSLNKQECDKRRASYAWKIHAALKKVSAPLQSAARFVPLAKSANPAGMRSESPQTIAIASVGNPAIVDYQEATMLTARYAAPKPVRNDAARPIRLVELAVEKVPEELEAADQEFNDWYNNPPDGAASDE